MKSLFKSKIRWQHRSNDPASPAGQPPQQASGPPSPSPASSPSGTAPALSVSTAASSSPPSAAATPTGAAAAAPAPAGAGAGTGAGGEDYISSEEEFQMQLAMALSASSNGNCVGDLDGEQIRKAKLMSLDRFAAHRDETHTAELLSRRYWVSLPFGTIVNYIIYSTFGASTC